MAIDTTFQDLVSRALARPSEQLVHGLGMLLDLARDASMRDPVVLYGNSIDGDFL